MHCSLVITRSTYIWISFGGGGGGGGGGAGCGGGGAGCGAGGGGDGGGGGVKSAYELLNQWALKISTLYKNYIFQCMGKIFCVEFQMFPLKFHTKYLTHAWKDVNFI